MKNEPINQDFYELVSHHWEIETVPSEWTLFIQALKNKIHDLYQNQPEKLIQILYRLDVPEDQFIYATQLEKIEDTIQYLTQKIIERELKRYHFRKKYRE